CSGVKVNRLLGDHGLFFLVLLLRIFPFVKFIQGHAELRTGTSLMSLFITAPTGQFGWVPSGWKPPCESSWASTIPHHIRGGLASLGFLFFLQLPGIQV